MPQRCAQEANTITTTWGQELKRPNDYCGISHMAHNVSQGRTWEIMTIHADGDTAQMMRTTSLVLVDKRFVDPSYSAAACLQHLEELGGQHGLQPTEHLQLLQPPTGCSQCHLKPFYGDP